MSSNKLERTKRDLMGNGEDYPLKTCIMERVVLWNFGKECFDVGLDLFLLLPFGLGFLAFTGGQKLFLGWEDWFFLFYITAFPPFITVCRNP